MYEEEQSGLEGDEEGWQVKKIRHITLGNQTIAHFTLNIGAETEKALVFGDHLGSASLLTDTFGRPKMLYDYYPFGSSRMEQAIGGGMQIAGTQYQYTGKELDRESGLNYYGARYYASAIGKFTQPDELSKSVPHDYLANPQNLNEYAYATNNPIMKVDPTGKTSVLAAELAGAYGTLMLIGAWVGQHPEEAAAWVAAVTFTGLAISSYTQGVYYTITGNKEKADEAFAQSRAYLLAAGTSALVAAYIKEKAEADLKSKQSNTATGKTEPETSGPENNASKPKPTNTQQPINQSNSLVNNIDEHGAYEKHVLGQNNPNGREYGTLFQNKDQWNEYLDSVISKPSASFSGPTKDLYWDDRLGTIIINNKTGGVPTAFHPQEGYSYYQNEVSRQQQLINY